MCLSDFLIIGVVGSRTRDDEPTKKAIFDELKKHWIKDKTIICSGGCSKGADRIAKEIAQEYELPYLEFPARWSKHGKAAGFIRNATIAEVSEILIAVINLNHKGGTENTIERFTNKIKELDGVALGERLFLL